VTAIGGKNSIKKKKMRRKEDKKQKKKMNQRIWKIRERSEKETI